ncbi:hypothetical protein GCM10009120_05090 [Sphingobacterium siyangense subsp. cladoniae]
MNLFLSEIDGNKVVGLANSLDLTAFLCRAQLRCAVLCPWINFLIVDMKSIFLSFLQEIIVIPFRIPFICTNLKLDGEKFIDS